MKKFMFAGMLALMFSTQALAQNAPSSLAVIEYNSLPRRGLICHQAGKAIVDQGNLDHIRLYSDQSGVLRRVDYKRDPYEWQTVTVSTDTSCNVVGQ